MDRTSPRTGNTATVRCPGMLRRITAPSALPVASSLLSPGAKATVWTGARCSSSRAANGSDWVLSGAPRASGVSWARKACSAGSIDASGRPSARAWGCATRSW
ncbi:hypothetical protein [Actinacidiphila glaucinigra]|uniref:Uncharacterized protein n=1 Tax=Actinacidiphila glaucinigra TaxID=235986 RepID=A0A239NG97_9ACTN|nr:hypothetical protein [Actinacidiphila glaucinigra]SNT53328.1 hypothetical protein SAMN05216252_13520 [Actinacidiphila glaucinigra]